MSEPRYSRELTPEEREAMIASTIGSMALAGIDVSREEAEAAFERVIREPLLELDPRTRQE